MQFLKILFFVVLISYVPNFAAAQDTHPNLTVIGVKPKIDTSEYKYIYRETGKEQLVKKATVKMLLGMTDSTLTYQFYLPKGYTSKHKYPVVVLLHDLNRTGKSMAERWKSLADEVGLILIAPNAFNKDWINASFFTTYADLFDQMVTDISLKYSTDPERTYLYGHSTGGLLALVIPYFKPDLFDAIVVHGSKVLDTYEDDISEYKTKVPVMFQIGTADSKYSLKQVKQSARIFAVNGHKTVVEIYKGHNHWYYSLAPQLNRNALAFFLKYKKREFLDE